MMFEDLKNKSEKELHELLHEERESLRAHRFQAAEHQMKKVHVIRDIKKTIARILTVLHVKQSTK